MKGASDDQGKLEQALASIAVYHVALFCNYVARMHGVDEATTTLALLKLSEAAMDRFEKTAKHGDA